jgi:hypothetical protein
MRQYSGEIEGFPIEVVQKMLWHQVAQGNSESLAVFEKCNYEYHHGFHWDRTIEGDPFLQDVIINRNFGLFFERYPKKISVDELSLPRVVMTSNDGHSWRKRVLFMIKLKAEKPFICWHDTDSIEKAEFVDGATGWKYVKEIPQMVRKTKQEIADLLHIDVSLLEIVDEK